MRKGTEDGLQARWREDSQVGEQRRSETIDRILDFILEANRKSRKGSKPDTEIIKSPSFQGHPSGQKRKE